MTLFHRTPDDLEIAYEVTGSGPGLILLHGGYTQDKSIWTDYSYVSELKGNYTVVTIDIRGHGESNQPSGSQNYSIDRILEDVGRIAQSVGLDRYQIWGFSLGASIALQCTRELPVNGIVAAGTVFGQELRQYAESSVKGLKEVVDLKQSGQLEMSQMDERDQYFLQHANLAAALSISEAMTTWPIVEPADLGTRCLIYSGSNDEPICSILKRQAVEIRRTGANLEIFDGLDHSGLLERKAVVFPAVQRFLAAGCASA